jgi:hypothetical protein
MTTGTARRAIRAGFVPTPPMSWRPAGIAHDARALCACGRKAGLEDFSYG